MLKGHRIGGLLLMGGVGQRFGSETPKQFHRLAGQMLFLHTLKAFLSSRLFDEIVLSCHPDWIETIKSSLPLSHCPIRLIPGGTSRQESSYQGLLGFSEKPDIVVIHDAVRPFVTSKIIFENIDLAIKMGAVDTCIPSADTLVHAPDHQTISAIPKRSDYLRGQTPQSFSYSLIRKAHEETKRTNCSDDCQLVSDLGHPVAIVNGDEYNIKITSELDLYLAEQILRIRLHHLSKIQSNSLSGQRFIIVGGTGGIGSAIAEKIHSIGGAVILLSRTSSPFSLDLKNSASIEEVFQKIHLKAGPIDGLINCAGCLQKGPLSHLSLQQIETMIDVNLLGLILCCKNANLKSGAHVINIASSSFSRGRKDLSVYSSAKAGVVNFTQSLAEERPDLHVHAVIPARTNTALRRQNFPDEDIRTLLDPRFIADAVIQLLQDHEYTGLSIEVKNA